MSSKIFLLIKLPYLAKILKNVITEVTIKLLLLQVSVHSSPSFARDGLPSLVRIGFGFTKHFDQYHKNLSEHVQICKPDIIADARISFL